MDVCSTPVSTMDNSINYGSYVWSITPNGEFPPPVRRMRSNEVRKLRRDAMESGHSQSTVYFTPGVSFTSSSNSAKESRSDTSQSRPYRTTSEPLRRNHTKTKSTLKRLASCFVCHKVDEMELYVSSEYNEEETASATPPRRLQSGGPNGIDLQRFDKTDGQRREFHSPQMESSIELLKSASLPIPVSPVAGVLAEKSDYSNGQFNRVRNLQRLKRMSGVYQLDRSRSDSVRPMSDLLEFSWPLRKAFENSDLMEIQVEDDIIHQTGRVFRMVDIAEELHLSGEEVQLRRRDLRRGPLFAKTFLTPSGYINKLHWNDPCEGGLVETFEFNDEGTELSVRFYVYRTDGRKCNFTLVWKRRQN